MMSKRLFSFLLFIPLLNAEVHSLTLQQALELAARQNPEVILARLDEQRAVEGVKVALDPFRPKVYGGSGLAYEYGYPNSIDGNAPSIIQLKTDMALFNRMKSYEVASARETARGSQFNAQVKAEDVAYQAADLFLTAATIAHEGETLSQQLPSLQKVSEAMSAAVNEGSELPLELKRAKVNLAVSQERFSSSQLDLDYYEMMLAVALGFPATDRVKTVDSDLSATPTPPTEEDAADMALRNNRQLRQMRSQVLAKQLQVRSFRAAFLPQVNLVAQYSLFAKYNYSDYFQHFQRNNYQVGASITIPVLVGSASRGLAEQNNTDLQKIRIQMDQTRNRIISDTRRSYEQWKKAENIRDLSRLQLDLAREELTVLLAKQGEGQVPMSRVEQARLEESNRWIALYEAETQVTRAKLAIFRETGTLLAVVRSIPPAPVP
jgi:outer membrane protein TolC